jgi:probable F420-dependent oxidoreductase
MKAGGGTRPFRFGLQVGSAANAQEWAEKARWAESLGFDVMLMPDHIGYPLWSFGPALAAAAAATTTLRLGTFVIDNDFRHPALVAAEAATLDRLSNGRFELGLGAGWDRNDYERSGIAFDPPLVRTARLEESVQIIKGLFGSEPVTFSGAHYSVTDLEGHPKPVQQPHLPIHIGAGGKRMLSLAAREADIVSVVVRALPEGGLDSTDGTAASMDAKIAWLREQAEDRYERLEINMLVQHVDVTDHPAAVFDEIARLWELRDRATAEKVPFVLVGSVDQITERLEMLRERWDFSYIVIRQHYGDTDAVEALIPVIHRLAGK